MESLASERRLQLRIIRQYISDISLFLSDNDMTLVAFYLSCILICG